MLGNYRKVLIAGFAFVILAAGCTHSSQDDAGPKGRLTDYISKSFAVTSEADRIQLLTFLTGDAKTRLAAWSDDQFRQAFIVSKREFQKLLIREVKTLDPSDVEITYELSYIDQGKGKDAKVTNRKLCQMTLDHGNWYIKDVRNIKELVEYQNELALP